MGPRMYADISNSYSYRMLGMHIDMCAISREMRGRNSWKNTRDIVRLCDKKEVGFYVIEDFRLEKETFYIIV